MPVGFSGVVDRVNTTNGGASGVFAYGYVSGAGVVMGSGITPPPQYINTEGGDRIETESADNLTTE